MEIYTTGSHLAILKENMLISIFCRELDEKIVSTLMSLNLFIQLSARKQIRMFPKMLTLSLLRGVQTESKANFGLVRSFVQSTLNRANSSHTGTNCRPATNRLDCVWNLTVCLSLAQPQPPGNVNPIPSNRSVCLGFMKPLNKPNFFSHKFKHFTNSRSLPQFAPPEAIFLQSLPFTSFQLLNMPKIPLLFSLNTT